LIWIIELIDGFVLKNAVMKKPDTRTAMQSMINETSEAVMCADDSSCQGCSLKLLEFLAMELDNW